MSTLEDIQDRLANLEEVLSRMGEHGVPEAPTAEAEPEPQAEEDPFAALREMLNALVVYLKALPPPEGEDAPELPDLLPEEEKKEPAERKDPTAPLRESIGQVLQYLEAVKPDTISIIPYEPDAEEEDESGPPADVVGVGGIVVHQGPEGIVIGKADDDLPEHGGILPPDGFWAIIDSSTATNGSGTNHATDPSTQWTYDVAEAEKTAAGYDGWTVKVGGRTGTAYNRKEEINTNIVAATPGVMGNGVDLANCDYDTDATYEFAPQPIPDGSVVWVEIESFSVAGGTAYEEYWIDEANGIDGGCD
ncbi:MAG TPA: hypothetical protein VNA25_17845 [Phycisphaerae bacterium]|nr:hypothetical protein [Phycisphaerae bacterium]